MPVLIASRAGGVESEGVAAKSPQHIVRTLTESGLRVMVDDDLPEAAKKVVAAR